MSVTSPSDQSLSRMRHIPLAFALLGVLGVLVAGGAVLGVIQGPTPKVPALRNTTVALRRAAARTLDADRVVGTYCYAKECDASQPFVYHFSYTAPDTTDMFATHGRHVVGGSRCSGTCARRVGASVLQPVLALSAFHDFTLRGGFYESTKEPDSVFTRSIESKVGGVSRLGGALSLLVSTVGNEKGYVRVWAQVSSGYVVLVDLKVVIDVQGPGQPTELRGLHQWVIPVRFTQVGSWRAA